MHKRDVGSQGEEVKSLNFLNTFGAEPPCNSLGFSSVFKGCSHVFPNLAGACSLMLKTTADPNELLANKIPHGLYQASAQGLPTSTLHSFDCTTPPASAGKRQRKREIT